VVERLREHFEAGSPGRCGLVPQELPRAWQGKDGVLTTGSERIDAELLAACPQLKIVANMAVGYNNFRRAR
jgi:gluconate 2-dehydrogenase